MINTTATALRHRPASSSCPKGAWFSDHYHTSWAYGAWCVWETGIQEIANYGRVSEAKARMLAEEATRQERATP